MGLQEVWQKPEDEQSYDEKSFTNTRHSGTVPRGADETVEAWYG